MFGLLLMAGCREVPVVENDEAKADPLKESLINANRLTAQSEETKIDAYIARRGWEMQRLSGGARVMETSHGKTTIGYEDRVVIVYSVEDLGGNIIYGEKRDTVVAGHLQPTPGLDAALRTLSYGSQAVVILPSEQAYGVVGDGERIGSRMVLVYKIKIAD